MKNFKDVFNSKKAKVAAALGSAAIMALPVTAFADETGGSFPITSDMLSGVTSNFNSAVAVAVPVGIGIMSLMLGVKFVPKLLKKFIN